MTPEQFQRQFMPYAQNVSRKTGLDPRMVLAQAALETGWGQSAPNNNFFGIKSHGKTGGSNLMTKEFEGGRMVKKPQSFRGYENPEQSFQGYADFFLDNPRYGDVLAQGDLAGPNQAIADDALRAIGKQPAGSIANAPTGGILSNEGNQMAQQQQPQGLLSSMGIQRRDPNAQGETSQPFYDRKSFGDTMARIAPMLGRMGVMGLEGPAQAALDSRNKRQGDERALAKASQQRNATAEWLRSQGSNELADGVLSGAITGAQALSNMQASAGGSDTVQSSVPLDDGTTVIIMRNGSRRVLAPDGTELSGQAAADAILAAREYTVANQTAIYQGRTTGTNTANMNTGGQASAVVSEGTALGKANAEDAIQLRTMQRNMPGLEDTVSRLDELSGRASYGKAAVLADDARRALGKEVSPGGIARAEYIAIVDNEILPLLKQTFGAAFTEEEGARLRATLGNEDATPAERRASLDAFIKQKKAQIQSYSGPQTPTAGTLSSEADAFMRGN